MKQPTLRPSDVVVACQLAITPEAIFLDIAKSTGLSAGECHNATRRLRLAQLILADERRPPVELLQQFLTHGVPFAFPAVIGPRVLGVPTAASAFPFRDLVVVADGFVWPHADGTDRGQSLLPLFPGAPMLSFNNPPLYELLVLTDALRVGTARIRKLAGELLSHRLNTPAT